MINVEVFLKDETVWLAQKALAELFCAERSVITKHLENIFKDGELVENSVCAIIAHTASDEKNTKQNFTTLTPLFQWVTGSTHIRQPDSAFGPQKH